MAEYYVKKQQVDAPHEGDLLPRYAYTITCVNTSDNTDVQVVSFLSDDENPLSAKDTCTTCEGLLGGGNTLDVDCTSL